MHISQFPNTASPPIRESEAAPKRRYRGWRLINTLQRWGALSDDWRHSLLRRAGCDLHDTATVREDVFIGGPGLRMDANSYVNVGCLLDGCASIHIGEGARLGPRVMVLTGTHEYQHSVLRRSLTGRNINLPVAISRGCWIGIGAIIMPGVTVAEGCIVGAGAVVLKSTEPNGLYAGNPARRVRDLPVE
jgi:acetyltransferase-like isoleucine patch superfamily enzyme